MIKATIIADSMSMDGIRIVTFELEYPRFIHSELMTHRVFSRNAASSRAVPVKTMLEHIADAPAMPEHWGKNQPGMQAHAELEGVHKQAAIDTWKEAAKEAARWATVMNDMGLHKQIVNRVTEPFTHMKTVVTSTEWANFFSLRYHEDAQPEFFELAKLMRYAMDYSLPVVLGEGEWHLPYVARDTDLNLEAAKMVSASCCAQVSYRKNDDSPEKAKVIFDKLIHSIPCHASPVEHQATPIPFRSKTSGWANGITHQDRHRVLWSNNFRGWIQYRATLGI